jgi:AcrR family transcriptional regulator
MPRKPEPQRRSELLDDIVEYIATNGVNDLSLRPLAKALGHSTFVLSYHFGDKDGLIQAALEHFERKQRAMLVDPDGWEELPSLGDTIRRYWRWIVRDRNLRLLRFGLEVAFRTPEGFGSKMTSDWIDFVAAGLRRRGSTTAVARREATLIVATISGLLVDVMTTGDRRRVDAVLEDYASRVNATLSAAPR